MLWIPAGTRIPNELFIGAQIIVVNWLNGVSHVLKDRNGNAPEFLDTLFQAAQPEFRVVPKRYIPKTIWDHLLED